MPSLQFPFWLSLVFSVCLFLPYASADEHKTPAKKDNATVSEIFTENTGETSGLRIFAQASQDQLIKPAYLRERLPKSSIAYVRIPNPWLSLGSPGGNVFNAASGSEAYVNAVNSIKSGFAANLLPEFPQETRSAAKLLLQHINSPLEASALKSSDPFVPIPDLLVTASADFKTLESLQEVLTNIATASPAIQITKPVNDDGFAEIKAGTVVSQVFLDKTLKRLFIFISMKSTLTDFKKLLNGLDLNDEHSMLAVEKNIDESGQGIFVWVNPPELYGIAQKLGITEADLRPFKMAGVQMMKSAALGMGTSNGINRLKLLVEIPASGLRTLIPTISSSPTFNLKGETDVVAVLGLPSKLHIITYETMAEASSPKNTEDYYSFKKEFSDHLGFNFEELFDVFGQDLSIVMGETGTYLAIRLNNEKAFEEILGKSVKDFDLKYQQREIAGQTYHHLQLPPLSFVNFTQTNPQLKNNKLAERMLSVPTHLYWEQEEDYLLVATLPQVLMDRHNVSSEVPVDEWIRKQQRTDPEGTLLMVSAVNKGIPAAVYRMQLSVLSYLGDLTEQPVDLFNLPTVREAKIPEKGSYGLKVTSSDSQLALELNYEHNPFELILGSTYARTYIAGLSAFLGIGILEELSNQQDQQQLISGITAANKLSSLLDDYKGGAGNYPGQAEIDALGLNQDTNTYTLSVEETGRIKLKFKLPDLLGDKQTLTLEPPTGDNPDWQCVSDIPDEYLPESCQ